MKKFNKAKIKEMGKSFTNGALAVLESKETYAGAALGLVLSGGLKRGLKDNIEQTAGGIAFAIVVNGVMHLVIDALDSEDEALLVED